jgi:sugar lactone lactonase YvrE
MKKLKTDILYLSDCELGESPVWDAALSVCYWVDITGKKMFVLNWLTHQVEVVQFSQMISLVVPGRKGDLILGMQGGIYRFNPKEGALNCLTDFGMDWKQHRCNDGIADSRGRLWVGTMDLDCKEAAGTVYCVNQELQITKQIENVTISNGMAWSPDDTRLYYIDSTSSLVRSYLYEPEEGTIRFEKNVVQVPKETGLPDGMAIDAEGMLWVAIWGGFGVARYNPANGRQIGWVELPVPQVSSCCFAGEQLDVLVITTARQGMTPVELNKYPLSGHVFHVRPGVTGLPGFICSL